MDKDKDPLRASKKRSLLEVVFILNFRQTVSIESKTTRVYS